MPLLSFINLLALLALSSAGIGAFLAGISQIYRRVRAGQADPGRTGQVGRRLWGTVTRVLSHRAFRAKPAVLVAHWLVMVSFPLLLLTLVTGYGQALSPAWELPILGHNPWWYGFTNLVALLGLGGIIYLFALRLKSGGGKDESPDNRRGEAGQPPARFRGSSRWQAFFVESVIFIVCACVLTLHGAGALRVALGQTPLGAPINMQAAGDFDAISRAVGAALGALVGSGAGAREASEILIMEISMLKVAVSMIWLLTVGIVPTMGIAWHRFLALFTVYFRRDLTPYSADNKALGELPPLRLGGGDGRELTAELLSQPESLSGPQGQAPILGALTARDLTWKNLLDAATCTECGRCAEACPAWATGKVLSPKELIMGVRDAALDTPLIREENGRGVIDPQAVWDCTNCGACVAACPVDIEHLSILSALRRGSVLTQGTVPAPYTKVLRKVQSKGNAWGVAPKKRLDWAADLDFEIPVVGVDIVDASEVDYLFWVGSAGSFDADSQRTTRAVAELLHRAGVSFAVLGVGEPPTGDLARRLGDEALYLQQSAAAIEILRAARPQRILCTSPHVFNVIAREYRQQGANFSVWHHTQVLNSLVRQGRLRLGPIAPGAQGRPLITFHDPCFLGRHNGEFEAPRELLSHVGDLVEMPRNRKLSMCCGAGGGHAFVEDSQGVRISAARAAEAAATGARFIATACPYCHLMLESALPETGEGTRPVVRDVAQLLLEAARAAD